jgi:DNA-binding transcriptional MerR regulator
MPDLPRPQIPDRLYFRIGDVSELVGVEPYVLRFWESEFPMLQPRKSKTGQREYKRKDVELLLEIKRLLYDEGFTIPGARKAMRERSRGGRKKRENSEPQTQLALISETPVPDLRPTLREIREELAGIAELLRRSR